MKINMTRFYKANICTFLFLGVLIILWSLVFVIIYVSYPGLNGMLELEYSDHFHLDSIEQKINSAKSVDFNSGGDLRGAYQLVFNIYDFVGWY